MVAPYRLYGADLSPYSVKIRQLLRFKGIEHEWLPRTQARQAEFARFAKLPLIPVLVGADDYSLQDSTPIAETLERRYPEPSITPDDPALAFISALLEDYADEWVNKAMFHYRWTYPADQESAARRIVDTMLDGASVPDRAGVEASVRSRMTERLHFVGSSAETAPVIEASYERLLRLLEAHLVGRPYIFGARPALADFGLAGQLGQLASDPTPGALLKARAPGVAAWLKRMDDANVEGPFETFEQLSSTLGPLLHEEIAGAYLPWMAANAAAASEGLDVTVDLPGGRFTQKPQKYAARAFMDVRGRRAMVAGDAALAALLRDTGCDRWLEPPAKAPVSGEPTSDTSDDVLDDTADA
jgi:glutathione S-transferase